MFCLHSSLAGIPRLSCPFCQVHVESGANGADFELLEVHVRAAHMQQGGQIVVKAPCVTDTPEATKFLNVARAPALTKVPEATMTANVTKAPNGPKKIFVAPNLLKRTPTVTKAPEAPHVTDTPVVAMTPNARPDVTCPQCDLAVKSNILIHLRDEHEGAHPVKCPFCGWFSSGFESLWQHADQAHGDQADTREVAIQWDVVANITTLKPAQDAI